MLLLFVKTLKTAFLSVFSKGLYEKKNFVYIKVKLVNEKVLVAVLASY